MLVDGVHAQNRVECNRGKIEIPAREHEINVSNLDHDPIRKSLIRLTTSTPNKMRMMYTKLRYTITPSLTIMAANCIFVSTNLLVVQVRYETKPNM